VHRPVVWSGGISSPGSRPRLGSISYTSGRVVLAKGGNLPKFQDGSTVPDLTQISKGIDDDIYNWVEKQNNRNNEYVEFLPELSDVKAKLDSNQVERERAEWLAKTKLKQPKSSKPVKDAGWPGGFTDKGYNVNYANLADTGWMLYQLAEQNRAYKKQDEALQILKDRQFNTPQLTTTRLDTSPIEHKYDVAADPYRQVQMTSSDPRENMANNLSIASALSGLEQQKGAEIANEVKNHNAEVVGTYNKQQALNADTANKQSEYLVGINSQQKALEGQHIEDRMANISNTYSHQMRQQLRTAQDAVTKAKYAGEELAARQAFDRAKKQVDADMQAKYEAAGGDEKWTSRNAWELSNDPSYVNNKETWDNMLAQGRLPYEQLQQKIAAEGLKSELNPIYKSGGQVYKHRTVTDSLVIQGDAAAKRAVQNCKNNLARLLQQLLK